MPEEFRQISSRDYRNIDDGTKRQLLNARHVGILRNATAPIYESLRIALQAGHQQEDLVAVCMHVDDPITPLPLKTACERDSLEVAVFISKRLELANSILDVEIEKKVRKGDKRVIVKKKPYAKAAKALQTPPQAGTVYIAVFDSGMCTLTMNEFNIAMALPPEPIVQEKILELIAPEVDAIEAPKDPEKAS